MKAKAIDEKVVDRVQAAAALNGAASWVHMMGADELDALADRVQNVASGLVGAASRIRRMAKQKKKSGVIAAHHIK